MTTSPPVRARRAFRDVDGDDAGRLVAMMDATDAWPEVRAARTWVLEQAAVGRGSTVLDVGSGPGTFAGVAQALGACTVDVDRSGFMLAALRRRRSGAVVACADATRLPLRSGAIDLAHAERVLQWTTDAGAALSELARVSRDFVAITDTDWGCFAIDHPDEAAAARLSAAARRWVPHPLLARTVPRRLRDAGATEVSVRTDATAIAAWDPDDPEQRDGPPGLPLRTIAAAAPGSGGSAAAADVDALAELARRGRFFATLTLVTALGRF